MKMSRLSQSGAWAVLLMMVLAASAALGKSGQERNGPIICEDMRGRRSPAGGPDCPWYTGSVVVGLGEAGEFEIPYVEDPDIFYDPYDVWDGICRHWEILDSNGQPAELGYYHEDATAHQEEDGRIWGTCYMKCGPMKRGTYTIICTMDDCRLPGDPAHDDPVVKQMTMDVRCEFRINQIFSTDGLNTDGGSPSAGLVGVDVEWTAGCPPWLIASHMCDYLYAPQSVPEICWITMSEERPVDFPHRGKYYFNSAFSPATYWLHNSDDESNWTLTVGPHPGCYFQPNDWEECKVEQEFELHNLSVEDVSPEYLTYDPEAGSGTTITYKLNDAYEICPEAQQTDVYLTMNSSNGQFIRSESFLQTAGRERTYTYTWDGTDWEGNQCPKGIYIYYIIAYQYALIPDPTIPENYFTHDEQDMDKSDWSLSTNAEIIACDENTGASTVRVSFAVDPGIMPEGANWKIDHAKLEVFDPDLLQIASAQVGESPVAQTVYFPDLNIDFDKGGTYVFLVSAWDRLYKDRVPISRTHESKPLYQGNARITIPELTLEWDCMPDCSLGDHKIVETGLKEAWAKVGYALKVDPDHDLNCTYHEFIRDTYPTDQDLQNYFLDILGGYENQNCKLYLCGMHRCWSTESTDPNKRVLGYCANQSWSIVFEHYMGETMDSTKKKRIELHETACHDITLTNPSPPIGHCRRNDAACFCRSPYSDTSTRFCDDDNQSTDSNSQYCAPRLRYFRENQPQ